MWNVTTFGFILAEQSESKTGKYRKKRNSFLKSKKGSQILSVQNNSVHKHLVTNKCSWFLEILLYHISHSTASVFTKKKSLQGVANLKPPRLKKGRFHPQWFKSFTLGVFSNDPVGRNQFNQFPHSGQTRHTTFTFLTKYPMRRCQKSQFMWAGCMKERQSYNWMLQVKSESNYHQTRQK